MRKYPTRVDFLKSLPSGLTIAEVGVLCGFFSRQIIEFAKPRLLHLIDSWRPQPGDDQSSSYAEELEGHYHQVCQGVGADKRARVWRITSAEALEKFEDESFDVIYLSNARSREGFAAGLSWWKKIRAGGMLCGHDYVAGCQQIQVKEAVDEWLEKEGLELDWVTTEEWPSWGVRKPG